MNSVLQRAMERVVRPAFIPFDEQKAVRIYQRNLPHWRQEGTTYFVTFRLGDSIPQGVIESWEYERRAWLVARGIHSCDDTKDWLEQLKRLPKFEQDQFHKHFNRLFHRALDEGCGECHLKTSCCLTVIQSTLLEGDGRSYHLGDFVVMPNHVHLLMMPSFGFELEQLLKGIKGSTARECNRLLGRTGRFWQPDSYDHIVRTLEQLAHFREYIAENPQKAGITTAEKARYHAKWMDDWFS
jgi:putative transposase